MIVSDQLFSLQPKVGNGLLDAVAYWGDVIKAKSELVYNSKQR